MLKKRDPRLSIRDHVAELKIKAEDNEQENSDISSHSISDHSAGRDKEAKELSKLEKM